MRQITHVAIATVLALSIGGCTLFPGGDSEPELIESTPVVPQDPQSTQPTGEGEGQEFAEPTVEETGGPVGNLPLDLIPSTDPGARVSEIERQRSDPFAILPTTPTVEIPVQETTAPQPSPPSPSTPPGELAPIPELVPSQPPGPPPPPQPELARAVAVSGVVQLGNVPYAILTAPNEPHTRYVRAGQLLSNGEVLVKRIEMYPGRDPVVVLEQFGVEVVRAVGSGGPPSESEDTAAVAIAG